MLAGLVKWVLGGWATRRETAQRRWRLNGATSLAAMVGGGGLRLAGGSRRCARVAACWLAAMACGFAGGWRRSERAKQPSNHRGHRGHRGGRLGDSARPNRLIHQDAPQLHDTEEAEKQSTQRAHWNRVRRATSPDDLLLGTAAREASIADASEAVERVPFSAPGGTEYSKGFL